MISPSVVLGFLFSIINENGVFTARKTGISHRWPIRRFLLHAMLKSQ